MMTHLSHNSILSRVQIEQCESWKIETYHSKIIIFENYTLVAYGSKPRDYVFHDSDHVNLLQGFCKRLNKAIFEVTEVKALYV